MKRLRTEQPQEYTDGRTKQAFKDETDINKLLERAQKTGTLSHLQKYEGRYADFSDFDFFDANIKLAQGREIFDALPSEVRSEFNNSPAGFFKYVNDPANADDLKNKLPGLAAPGRQNIDVSGKTSPDVAREPEATETTTADPELGVSAESPQASSDEPTTSV